MCYRRFCLRHFKFTVREKPSNQFLDVFRLLFATDDADEEIIRVAYLLNISGERVIYGGAGVRTGWKAGDCCRIMSAKSGNL